MRYIQDPSTLELVPAEGYSRQESPYFILGDYEPYQCPKTGEVISGRLQHRAALARHGCHVLEPGEKEEVAKSWEEKDKDLEKRYMKFCVEYMNDRNLFRGE